MTSDSRPAGDAAAPPVGRIQTVRGPIDPAELGVTLGHEHIFIDLRKTHLPNRRWVVRDDRLVAEVADEDYPVAELARWEAKVSAANIADARALAPITDNYWLADEEIAVQELEFYRALGGRAVMDVTAMGLKRDPIAIRRVSERTGLHVIMGTGWYQRVYHPDDMASRTVEQLTEAIVADVAHGIHDGRVRTDVRAGLIGEIGINGGPLITNERTSMRAAARAARLTGACIVIHLGGVGAEKHEILDIVADEGVDLGRVILGHSDSIAKDTPFITELLARGISVAFDTLGVEPHVLDPTEAWEVAAAIPGLIDAGYRDRIVLSQDICWKSSLRMFGGPGYAWVLERFLPRLREMGVGEDAIEAFMVRTPARLLTFAEPAPA
ncbi:MAG: aryldialkylphosphatase [Chloroflexi bacterium]|nr:aryldialkylphosphatase [Chloroflexota bacterium]